MPGSWMEYIKSVLIDSGFVTKAAICGLDGKLWAASDDFDIAASDIRGVLGAFVDPTELRIDGIHLGTEEYTCTRADGVIIAGRESTHGTGCILYKCNTCLIVGVFGEGGHPGGCYNIILKLGDYLRDNSY